jgi:hypothetical protein
MFSKLIELRAKQSDLRFSVSDIQDGDYKASRKKKSNKGGEYENEVSFLMSIVAVGLVTKINTRSL